MPPHHSGPSLSASAAVGFISEDEYLEITGIAREQSGEYECSASNDVSAPVVQRVKVTVNCEYLGAIRGQGWGWRGSLCCPTREWHLEARHTKAPERDRRQQFF